MTGTKLWRLSLAAILGFGWLFLTPAYSDDAITIAAQQISDLQSNINKLNDKAETQRLLDIAVQKYNEAISARDSKISAQQTYDTAVNNQATALTDKNIAQNVVNDQTSIVTTKLQAKNTAKNSLDIANINLSNTPVPSYGYQGVYFRIYPLSRDGNVAVLSPDAGLMCHGIIPTFDVWAGWGGICGLSENIIGIFQARFIVPDGINSVRFAGYTDDGFRLYVNGELATSQWIEQGATWSPYTQWYDTSVNKTINLEAWWYNGGGPGSMTLGWMTPQYLTGIPNEYLRYGQTSSQEVINTYNAAVSAQQTAQTNYNNKLAEYNSANSLLTTYSQTLTEKTTIYNNAVSSTQAAQTNLNTANSNYDAAIIAMNDSIAVAQNEYNKQWDFEEKQRIAAAIAQALANQPQPTPQPSPEIIIEPSPKPTPEQTKPVDPTPEPTPEITLEPTPEPTVDPQPTSQPSPKPSPQTTDISPSPKPEPSSSPSRIPDKTINAPVDAQTANLIADLTNSNTLTKLTPEQKATVAGTLGIKTTEIAIVAELAKSNEVVAKALEQFGNRANDNLNALMPYTLADATTEVQAEKLLSDPIGALTNIDFEKVFDPSQWGKDMTDDQREKTQEVVIPVIIASNIVAAAMTRRV